MYSIVFFPKCQPVATNTPSIDFFHNPRCRKSRESLILLEEAGKSPRIILYLDTPPTETELKAILKKLDMSPFELIRKEEAVFKDEFKGKTFSDEEWVKIMVMNPKLIQRPIAVLGNKAVIGRPPEQVLDLIK